MHIDFNEQQAPDATTLLKFRHMLEKNGIGEKIFADVNKHLDEAGLMMHGGTISWGVWHKCTHLKGNDF